MNKNVCYLCRCRSCRNGDQEAKRPNILPVKRVQKNMPGSIGHVRNSPHRPIYFGQEGKKKITYLDLCT